MFTTCVLLGSFGYLYIVCFLSIKKKKKKCFLGFVGFLFEKEELSGFCSKMRDFFDFCLKKRNFLGFCSKNRNFLGFVGFLLKKKEEFVRNSTMRSCLIR